MLTPELDILKPIDSSVSNSDDYEIYTLSNAHVVYEKNGKPANLLSAYANTPLRVEGRLEPPNRGQLKYLVKKPYKPTDVVIRNVTRFSYGQMTDGELVIWALGEAGWFEIQPRRDYKAIYQDMVEAVELLYFVADIYNEPRKRGGGPSAQLIFQEYAEDERFPCAELEGAAFEAAKAQIEGRYEPAKATPTAKSSPTPANQKKSASRAKTKAQKPSEAPPKKDDNWWEAAAIYEFMQSAVNKRALKVGHGHITLERVAKLMVKRYEIEEVDVAKNVVLVHAQNLCYKMEHPRSKSASFFTEEPLYDELQAEHDLPAAEIRKAEAVELRPRRDHALHREMTDSSEDDSDDGVLVTPQRRPNGRNKRGRLSVLRPPNSRFSGKGKGLKQGTGKRLNIEESSEEDLISNTEAADDNTSDSDSEFQTDRPGRGKRKYVDVEDDDEEKGRRKRTVSKSVTPESPSSSSEDDEDDAAEAPLPLRYRAHNPKTNEPLPKSNIVPPIVSSPLPTYEANGPRDSWTCTIDGCSHRIYGASKKIGRQLITEHLEDHEKGRDAVVGILLREEERLRLPVNNLLKKIRDMSEAQTPLFPSPTIEATSPALQPQPIRRVV
ncbi:hypothetical protein P280DRAFT_440325 [Massarina eburnea CBS 473.64]|uniref:DNA (cytosine-5)-methyltransferase 1 replication foci domain-containing protein n=1 Tax=Massarina eburnea CBS 473.64 TaxID=1395130 RepID=A0A6A6SEV2_9PLEO|nr:hypothetical protein P280DRAFT_440325 [Massarina eburnea CBS 473.64]